MRNICRAQKFCALFSKGDYMKVFKIKLLLVMTIAGLILGIGGFGDAMLLLEGTTLNLNEAEQSDFESASLIEGKINFVYGPFATLEETESTYGITTNVKETNFFIVGNFDSDTYMDYYNGDDKFDDFYVVFSTSNLATSSVLSKASNEWVAYLNGETDPSFGPPQITVEFSGKLSNQSSDNDYLNFRQDAFEELANANIKDYQFATLRIVGGEIGKTPLYLFF